MKLKSLQKRNLKEFSIFYLIINNLHFFKKNSNLFNDLNFITTDGKNVFLNLTEIISQ